MSAEFQNLKNIVNELNKEMKKENVEVVNEEENPKKYEKITNNKNVEPSLNMAPPLKKETEEIFTNNFNKDDIKQIKLLPKKKSRLTFFEDADSD